MTRPTSPSHRSIVACLDLGLPHRLDILTVSLGNQSLLLPPVHITKVRPLPCWGSLRGLGSDFLNRSVVFSFQLSRMQNRMAGGGQGVFWAAGIGHRTSQRPRSAASVPELSQPTALGWGARSAGALCDRIPVTWA
jgi:hypothetical protein